jgi:hypothetical protein
VWVREGVKVGLAAERMAEADADWRVAVGVGGEESERREAIVRMDRLRMENVDGEEEVDEADSMEQLLGTERSFC